jgi:hypothetical protein
MHNELRYQAKTHTISGKAIKRKKKKKLKRIIQKNNKDMLMEKEITSSPSM